MNSGARNILHIHTSTVSRGSRCLTDRECPLAVAVQHVRNVFLQHYVKIGAAKAKSANAGAPRAIRGHGPGFQRGIDVKRRVREVDIRIGMFAVHAGRQNFVAERQSSLQHARSTGSAFEMPDIRFD